MRAPSSVYFNCKYQKTSCKQARYLYLFHAQKYQVGARMLRVPAR
jgi:hypothetical protein